jgi:hypothetical protein
VAARSRQVQCGAALGVADINIVLWVLQQSSEAGRIKIQMLSILNFCIPASSLGSQPQCRTSWNSWRSPARSPAAEQLKMRGSGPPSSCLRSNLGASGISGQADQHTQYWVH